MLDLKLYLGLLKNENMEQRFSLIIVLCVLAISNVFSQIEIKVKNSLDLMNAIQSNSVIELAPGVYNISKIIEEINNPNVMLIDVFDGSEAKIFEISNLTIKGAGKAKIIVEPRYAWVMSFVNCTNIKVEGITFGHTESGYCEGGVLKFVSCYAINITNCKLFGSGTVGIMANMCTDLSVKKLEIYECTYGLTYIHNCNNVSFSRTTFRNTGEYNLIEIMQLGNVLFNKCKFTDNFTGEFMPHLFYIDENLWFETVENAELKESDLTILNCTFKNNKIPNFINGEKKLTIKGCKFSGNGFDM